MKRFITKTNYIVIANEALNHQMIMARGLGGSWHMYDASITPDNTTLARLH